MRFVERISTSFPNALVSEDVRQAVGDVHRYLDRPQDERGQRRSPFEESLVFNESVRKALGDLFFEKCAYCEAKVSLAEAAGRLRLSTRRDCPKGQRFLTPATTIRASISGSGRTAPTRRDPSEDVPPSTCST